MGRARRHPLCGQAITNKVQIRRRKVSTRIRPAPPRDDKVAQASCRKLSAFADNHRTDMCQVLYFNQHLATWQIDLRTNA